MSGATIWSRNTIESDIFFYKPDKWFKIWFYIVNRVNFKDSTLFKRGEMLITYDEIIRCTKSTKSQVEKCLKWMEKEDMLASRQTTRGRIRIVRNYNKYQDLQFYKEDLEKSRENNERRPGEESEQVPIRKNDKNVKNVNNKIAIYDLNDTHFEPIAQKYEVPISFVRSEYDSMVNWHESSGKIRKDWIATLRGFVKRDALSVRKEANGRPNNFGKPSGGIFIDR